MRRRLVGEISVAGNPDVQLQDLSDLAEADGLIDSVQ